MRMLSEGELDRLAISASLAERLKAELAIVSAEFVYNAQPKFVISLEKWLLHVPLLDELGGIVQQHSAYTSSAMRRAEAHVA
jgi:hypothetical protein